MRGLGAHADKLHLRSPTYVPAKGDNSMAVSNMSTLFRCRQMVLWKIEVVSRRAGLARDYI